MLTAAVLILASAAPPPNVVIVFCDDLGYADVGCFGNTAWPTPNIDRLAKEGVKFTDFYVPQPVCSASRAGLLTGCYPNRIGFHGALGPKAEHGLHPEERTLAAVLKAKGYATAAVGKWHLGHRPHALPTRHGFDSFFGLPYSNDMWPRHPQAKAGTYPPLPLLENETVIDPDVTPETMATLTEQYTARAEAFIAANAAKPFFLYLAHTMPHVPLAPGPKFRGGPGGTYGDVVRELDASVGRLAAALEKAGVAKKTLVIFTSDNGPWLSYGDHAGSAGPLRAGKGTTFEGGVRVPFVARWPGVIPAESIQHEPAMTIDLLPTVAKVAGADLPPRRIDGKDIAALLKCEPGATSPQAAYYFYYGVNELRAVRAGKWKLVLPHTSQTLTGPGDTGGTPVKYVPEKVPRMLFDLAADPGEKTDISAAHAEVMAEMEKHVESARADLGDKFTNRVGSGVREAGK